MAIEYINLKDFNTLEIKEIKSKVEKEYKKIQREIKNTKLKVDVRKAEKAGSRVKFSVKLHLEQGTSMVFTAHQFDWDLPRAHNKTLENRRREVEHRTHRDVTKSAPKKFSSK